MVFFFFLKSLNRVGCENYTRPKIWQPCLKIGQGWPWKGRGRMESQAPLLPTYPPPLPPPFLFPSPWSWGGGLGGGGAWVGSMYHPLPWLPPQTSSKIG
jgi:hypothetical protein